MNLMSLLDEMEKHPGCRLLPPAGIPAVAGACSLPEDLLAFYGRCGGAEVHLDKECRFRIVPPPEMVPSNPVIMGDYYRKYQAEIDCDISAAWHAIGTMSGPEEKIITDLDPARLGRCYDGFCETYATGDMKVIANSFAELLEQLFRAGGEGVFWEMEGFPDLGGAYDGS